MSPGRGEVGSMVTTRDRPDFQAAVGGVHPLPLFARSLTGLNTGLLDEPVFALGREATAPSWATQVL